MSALDRVSVGTSLNFLNPLSSLIMNVAKQGFDGVQGRADHALGLGVGHCSRVMPLPAIAISSHPDQHPQAMVLPPQPQPLIWETP